MKSNDWARGTLVVLSLQFWFSQFALLLISIFSHLEIINDLKYLSIINDQLIKWSMIDYQWFEGFINIDIIISSQPMSLILHRCFFPTTRQQLKKQKICRIKAFANISLIIFQLITTLLYQSDTKLIYSTLLETVLKFLCLLWQLGKNPREKNVFKRASPV